MADDSTNILHEQAGAMAGEYEYDYGSYTDLLEKQLGAIAHKAQLEKEEEAETGLLGTRNMAILNLALTGRGVVEGAREKYIMNQMKDIGGKEAQFISDEKYDLMDDIDRADYQKSADGRWFKGDWEYDKGPESKLKKIGNALIGWQQGIHKVATEGQGVQDVVSGKSEKVIEENVNAATTSGITVTPGPGKGEHVMDIPNESDESFKSKITTKLPRDKHPIGENVVDVNATEVTDKVFDSGIPEADDDENYSSTTLTDEDLGDLPASDVWGDAYKANFGVKGSDQDVADYKDMQELKDKTHTVKNSDDTIDGAVSNINEKKTSKSSGAMTAAEWDELRDGSSEEVMHKRGGATQAEWDAHWKSEQDLLDMAPESALAVSKEKPKMTSERWGGMNKKEQTAWRNEMKSELGILKSSNKMEKKSGLMQGLDALKKLKDSVVNKIAPPKGYSPSAAFKADNKSLYKQMKGVGINPLK